MLTTLLAASILASVPAAIERTDQENPSHLQILHQLEERIAELELKHSALRARVVEDEKIAVNTWKCFNRSLIGGGADLGTTALGLATRDDLKESNPLGFNTEARVALKFAQVGVTGWGCYMLEKSGHKKAANVASWASLIAQLGFAANNLILTLKH